MDEENKETANDTILLPMELVIEILTRVPAKSVGQFKCVSKEWLNLISDPYFIKRHVNQSIRANSNGTIIILQGITLYTFDFHSPNICATKLCIPKSINRPQPGMLHLVGSCNGLICIEFNKCITLYNPTTQAHKIIPQHNLTDEGSTYRTREIIFAYDGISDDYKVLRFENYQYRILHYSLSTNSWEIIENPTWDHDDVLFPGVVANNSLYWMASNHKNVKCFDLFTQRFYEISFPEKISPGYSPRLAVLGGRVFIVTHYFDIWKLEDYGAQEFSWTQIFRCPSSHWNIIFNLTSGLRNWPSTRWALACSEDGRKILVCGPPNFICCDLKAREATKVEIPGLSSNKFFTILPWAGSLVPLKD